jgi:hypothetical protein
MENIFKKSEKKEIKMTDLYNQYGLVIEGVSLSEDNKKIIVSDELANDGWRAEYSFQESSNIEYVLDEIKTKELLYEIKIAVVKDEPFSHIRCLLIKEKVV